MSGSAAVAAETASDALICGALSLSGVLSRGNRTSTSPIQNVKRSRKNICYSGCLSCSAVFRSLTVVDKSQVFALKLNREKFSKNPPGLIRRKFLIDADSRRGQAIHTFETIPKSFRKPAIHHLR